MVGIYQDAKRHCKYTASRFLQMLHDRGAVETARLLILSETPSDGFTALWECGRLDLTVEAHAIKDVFRPLFTNEEIERAEKRLADYG